MYEKTTWTLRPDDQARDTYTSTLGNLLVIGDRGVVKGLHGFTKVKVEVTGKTALVVAEDAMTYRGGHEVKEWLQGKESENLVFGG